MRLALGLRAQSHAKPSYKFGGLNSIALGAEIRREFAALRGKRSLSREAAGRMPDEQIPRPGARPAEPDWWRGISPSYASALRDSVFGMRYQCCPVHFRCRKLAERMA